MVEIFIVITNSLYYKDWVPKLMFSFTFLEKGEKENGASKMIGATGKQGLLLNNGNKDNNNTAAALSAESNKSPVPARKKVSLSPLI